MTILLDFVAANAPLLASLVALIISLRANHFAQQAHKLNILNKADADRILVFEKKRELLNEVDRQHTRLRTLMMLTAQKILLLGRHFSLREAMPQEFDRLRSNLDAVRALAERYDEQRAGIEAIDAGADIPALEEVLANIQRLTIHVEKDIAHEQAHLNDLRAGLPGRDGV